jgi:hypothetical protein
MAPRNVLGLPLIAAALIPLASPSAASVNLPGALMVPAISAPKYCSGAFRYAARDGNSDIPRISARPGSAR